MTNQVLDILKQCTIEGDVLKLPNIKMDRKLYQDVAKKISMISGKWSKKYQGFEFEEGCLDYFGDICNGDDINLQQAYQFFETPEEVANMVADLASYNWHETPSKTLKSKILEPSAGKGALIKALKNYHCGIMVDCYEAFHVNAKYLQDNLSSNINYLGEDFLQADESIKYDCIVMNPPFCKNQYIDHIMKAWSLLNSGGNIVAICPPSWQNNSSKKDKAFKAFIEDVGAEVINLDKGAFKSSGTMVETMILRIEKQ